MAVEIILPKLDEAMVSGKITSWRKKEGDRVEKGEVVFELETEKVTFEVEAPAAGILGGIRAKEGDELPVGEVVAYVLQPGEKAPEAVTTVAAKKVEKPREIRASPKARRMAEEHNVDLSLVVGTGPGGSIVVEDVLKAVGEAKKKAAPAAEKVGMAKPAPEEEIIPLTSLRETVARRMSQSFQSAPHFYMSVDVDAGELVELREKLMPPVEKVVGVRLTYTDLLIKIVARAVEEHPEVNVTWTDAGIKRLSDINIGLAIAIEKGLVVPVIRQANLKPLTEIAVVRADIVKRAGEGKITLSEMRGGSLTLSNLGMYGIDRFEAIINPPESCILAVGRIAKRPAVVNGELTVRPQMSLTLSIDHRVLDGATGARLLQRIKELIEEPTLMLLG